MAKKQVRSRKLPSRASADTHRDRVWEILDELGRHSSTRERRAARLHDAYHCGQIRYLRALQGVSTERF